LSERDYIVRVGRDGRLVYVPKRRSVSEHYKFFDPPRIVWEKINRRRWNYKTNREFYWLRDKAFMCLLYLTCCRVSELVRWVKRDKKTGETVIVKPSIRTSQFVRIGDFLRVRGLPILKRKDLRSLREYPRRGEVSLPLKGELSIFTKPITQYLNMLREDEELFKFRRVRGYQIVRYCTGEFPHYFREMGLKLWLRLYGMNIIMLKKFSGHVTLKNLLEYLKEAQSEEAERRLLTMKFEDFERV